VQIIVETYCYGAFGLKTPIHDHKVGALRGFDPLTLNFTLQQDTVVTHMHMQKIKVKGRMEWKQTDVTDCIIFLTNASG